MKNEAYIEPQGLTYEEAIAEAQRCLNCRHKPCVTGCVAHNEIPSMIQAFLAGNGEEAKRISETRTTFPEICGRVCYQDIQCEAMCVRMKQNAPVKIGLIERFIGDHYASKDVQSPKLAKKVAILGSGPSSLACASLLVEEGVDVTIYERKDILGGVLKYGIPPYRLPNVIVDTRIQTLIDKGVTFLSHQDIASQAEFERIQAEGFDAFFIGIGASKQNFSKIKGTDHPMVIGWKAFLSILNIGEQSFKEHFGHLKSICVVGGGNVAMDVVITARKFGMETHLLYRRTQDMMPARKAEIKEALHLGVILHELRDPIEIQEKDEQLKVTCAKTELVMVEGESRGKIVTSNETETLTCDLFVMAIGSSVRPLHFEGLKLDPSYQIMVDENYETSLSNVFAAGDGVTGTKTVIHALSAGRLAGQKIVERLTGKL